MADIDDGLEEAFKGFGDDPAPVTPPADPATPPVVEPPKEEPKPADEPKAPETPDKKTPEGEQPPAADDKKKEEEPKPPAAPETPPAGGAEEPKTPEAPQPLTKDDVQAVVNDLLTSERNSGKELETTTTEVLEKFYPEGLSNTLVDEATGKEIKTPADVVELSNGSMTTDQAAQWLMNEQFKLDNAVAKIKSDAKDIATTNINFKRDAVTALQKYEPLFKAYPQLQTKVYDKLMKQVKVDKDRGIILSAPDVMEHYDDFLEPYQQAFEFGTNKPATNPTPPPGGEPPKPGAEDRMDERGDGGAGDTPNDPNDFAQQVSKELAKGI